MQLTRIVSLINQLPALVENHIRLFRLECTYAYSEGRRSAWQMILLVFSVVNIALWVQLLIAYGLWRNGISLLGICWTFCFCWALVGGGIYYHLRRTQMRLGACWDGTRMEVDKSLQWIKNHLS